MKKIFTTLALAALASAGFSQNLYGSYENWRTYQAGFPSATLEAPYKWFGADSLLYTYGPLASLTPKQLLFKTSDAHGGSFAAKLISRDVGGTTGVIPGMIANAQPDIDLNNIDPNNPLAALTYTGGTYVSSRFQEVTAWIKYDPRGNDAGVIVVQAVLEEAGANNTDSVVGGGTFAISQPYNSYTQVSIPITYVDNMVVPDKLLVVFLSSNLNGSTTPADSTTLYVDDVNLTGANGVQETLALSDAVTLYPNPARDAIHVKYNSREALSIRMYNAAAQLVAAQALSENTVMDAQHLAAGIYMFEVMNKEGIVRQRGKITLTK